MLPLANERKVITRQFARCYNGDNNLAMAERLNTTFSRRTSSKRRIMNIANRFEQIKGELNAQQTIQGLRDDMREALSKFGEINELLWPLLEAAEMAPLTQLKNIYRQKDFEEAWNPVHDRAFYATKEAIANATLLVHPLPKAQTKIWCDASNFAVGAVLVQFQRGVWKPLSFWSKQLNHAQRGYSATDRELLAVSYAVDKFRAYLKGQPIIVRTYHQPLVGALTKTSDTALPVPRRHLLKIAQFVDQLHYLKGEEKRRRRCHATRPITTQRESDGNRYCRRRLGLG